MPSDKEKVLQVALMTALDNLAHIQAEVDLAITDLSALLDASDPHIHPPPSEFQ